MTINYIINKSPEILKFIISGVISAIIEFTLLIFLVKYMNVNYLLSNFFAFIVTNIVNYCLSRFWVFGPSQSPIIREASFFIVVAILGLLINQVVLWFGVAIIKMDYRLAKIFAMGMTVSINFISKKYLVFKPYKSK